MVSIWFYYSAVSVSQDVRLTRNIRALASSEIQFLDNNAYSQMEREIKQRAFNVPENFNMN
jgi:hypothetical protein